MSIRWHVLECPDACKTHVPAIAATDIASLFLHSPPFWWPEGKESGASGDATLRTSGSDETTERPIHIAIRLGTLHRS